jgi:hypothetical protein
MADGSLPAPAHERLARVGRWLAVHGEACLGQHDRIAGRLPAITNVGFWTQRGTTAWFWLARTWCGPTLALGGLRGRLLAATLLHAPARRLTWEQGDLRTRIHGLPQQPDEPELGLPVLRLEFAEPPSQVMPYAGCAV